MIGWMRTKVPRKGNWLETVTATLFTYYRLGYSDVPSRVKIHSLQFPISNHLGLLPRHRHKISSFLVRALIETLRIASCVGFMRVPMSHD
jgi:hypothetical protein